MAGKEAMNAEIVLSQLAFTLAVYLLLPVRNRRLRLVSPFWGVMLLGLVHFRGLRLADHMRSMIDDSAITTLLWLVWCSVAKLWIAALPDRLHRDMTPASVFWRCCHPATLGLSMTIHIASAIHRDF
jgi:hypothetical protein